MLELGKYFTFEPSKTKPIYNWFYYKEAFSPEIVEWALKQERLDKGTLVDPFCGIGTSLLVAKSKQLSAIGSDVSPLAVLVSQVKGENYSQAEIEEIRAFLKDVFKKIDAPGSVWEFELFSPKTAFPKSNLNRLLSLREKISEIENTKIRRFLLLANLSIIPQVSLIIKDGGVLKISKQKRAMPVKDAFKRKVKVMLRDLKQHAITGPVPVAQQADARDLPIESNTADIIVTSPPYLNNVDYSKVYGLEVSLMFLDRNITKQLRSQTVRSFITSNVPPKTVPEEVGEAGYKIPVIGNYFSDMEKILREIQRLLKPNAACYFIVGNSVIHGTEIFVDEILATMAQRLGLKADIIVGSERIADVKPRKVKIRESVLVFRKYA